jgi:amidase
MAVPKRPQGPVQKQVHAFTDDALGEHDAVGLVEEIRSGRVSRSEVVAAAIVRVQQVDPILAAVAADRYDLALAESESPVGGYFAGIPGFVKDNCDVAGLPSQHGSKAFIGAPKHADGDYAASFKTAGVTVLGKTRLSEYGFSASAEFVDEENVHNAWSTAHSSGASSAGSSVLVAAGAVPIAHANDGGGSIRIPAACNGLVGFKPSRGRTPQDKMLREMPVKIVSDGVVTRSVRDTAAYLREIERHFRAHRLPPIGDVTGPNKKRLRIGLLTDSIERDSDQEIRDAVRDAGHLLESMGHKVEEVVPYVPGSFQEDFLTYWALMAFAIETNGKRSMGKSFDKSLDSTLTRGLAKRAQKNLHKLPMVIARLQASRFGSAQFFRQYDAVISPTLAHVTPELGWLDPGQDYETVIDKLMDWVAFTPLANATGDPAVSLPLATDKRGLPIGLMLSGGRGSERQLLELSYELEEARPFRRIQDPVVQPLA